MARRGAIVAMAAGLTAAAAIGAVAAAGGGLPRGSEAVELDPRQFSTRIDNPYWPMRPGMRWDYREVENDGTVKRGSIRVTSRTRRIANGVVARVVRDTVKEDGALVEDTVDWYAQDREGNLWYLGEATKEYEGGKVVSTEGSWEAGVDGAQPGVVMPAEPRVGLAYRQEHYAGHAEDRASIVGVREQVQVPAGHYRNVVMTRDVDPLHPDVLEFKFYAPGAGPVLAIGVSGGGGREELVHLTR